MFLGGNIPDEQQKIRYITDHLAFQVIFITSRPLAPHQVPFPRYLQIQTIYYGLEWIDKVINKIFATVPETVVNVRSLTLPPHQPLLHILTVNVQPLEKLRGCI